jgi:hypothetical protein
MLSLFGAVWPGRGLQAGPSFSTHLILQQQTTHLRCCRSFEALILQAGWFPDAQLAVATMGLCSLTNSVT